MYKNRLTSNKLIRLVGNFPAVVIVGARQVGKSTLVQKLFGKTAETVVFDPVIDIENARQDPELFFQNHNTPLILDEIQYAPELIPVIKRRIDRNRAPGQFIMTGSQQWGVLNTIAESLAGRAVFLDLEGFSIGEIWSEENPCSMMAAWLTRMEDVIQSKLGRLPVRRTLYEQIWRGSLPEAQSLPPDVLPDFYKAYQRTYIERDVRLLADISDLQLFGRFFQLVSALTAQEINFSQLGRELGLTPQTSRRWLDILEHTFQWFNIPSYSGNTIKRVSHKHKGYIADTGLACLTQAISSPISIGGHPLLGPLFETMIAGEIRKQCAELPTAPNLYHWRSHGGAKLDFLLEFNGAFYPIEVKATSQPRRSDASGILAFRKTYPQLSVRPGMIIAPTEKLMKITETDYAIPWDLDVHSLTD